MTDGYPVCRLGPVARFTGPSDKYLNKQRVGRFVNKAPDKLDQRYLLYVLALDDKIELNRRMNATLEAMARALFQSWFVDFDPVRAKLDGRPPAALDPPPPPYSQTRFKTHRLDTFPKVGTRVQFFGKLTC
jgi:type I restriction enzyme, S subunit